MKKKKINRAGHAGKSLQEKEVYRQFLFSKFELDKTESDPIDTSKTSESSYDEDETPEVLKSKKKSLVLVVKDFINNNWFITIAGGLIVALIIGLTTFLFRIEVTQAVQGEKLSNIKNDVDSIGKANDSNQSDLSSAKQSFEVFKAETIKDLESIKK